MESVNITLKNPKAKRLLEELQELNLITINSISAGKKDLIKLLDSMRDRHSNPPGIGAISKEVEAVRKKRYAKK
ncbi:MAG TPA: hypothetical protein VG603_06925 [Chitinophagales bacterium]|nr:hypothetical protein [Chitinophagales bacterium]